MTHPRYSALPSRLDGWRDARNRVTHNIIYTRPTQKTYAEAFDDFMAQAQACATEGKALTADLTNWDGMARRHHARALKNPAS